MNSKQESVLYLNGNIYTVDARDSRAEAVLVKDGKIAFVGSNEDAKALAADRVVDLEGKTVIPGFIEGHGHLTWGAMDAVFRINLFGVDSADEYIPKIRKFIEENPDLEVYEGVGWENPFFGEKGPSRKILDKICPDKPILL